ncbi:error-prone DNA polymerase [Rhizobium paknamense]|nr:error-prone DNA polymerase [Rhizobium paknamense]
MGFYEIGASSNFSFLEGASHPQELVEKAQHLKLSGIGLADRNTVAGVVRLHAAAKAAGYAYQPGARLVFADDMPDCLAYPLNRRGWGHLCRLLSTGNLRSQKGVCTLFEADLLEWAEDLLLVVLPPQTAGPEATTGFRSHLETLAQCFGDRLYLALSPRYDGTDRLAFAELAQLGKTCRARLIATNLPLYHDRARRPLSDIVTAIREHVTVFEAGYRLAPNAERHLKDEAEMRRIFRDCPEAVDETVRFFRRMHFSLDEISHQYPEEGEPGESLPQTLRRLAYEGALVRYDGHIPPKVAQLLDYELRLIAEKQYEPFFLTVFRIIRFARSRHILCQGRGSAANSAVCYCLGITEVNPEKSTLLFERFISTEREEPPDIDVDFEHERREEIIQHIYSHYGREHAGLAAAVTSYRARSAGREVAKAFGLSEDVQSAISGSIWGWWTKTLTDEQAKAAGLDLKDETTRRLLHYSSELQSFPRHLSQHVGGFVITRDRLDEVVPLMNTADGRYMIEWDKDDLDTLKLLKVDVLALGMLTCMARAFRLLQQHYGRLEDLHSVMREEDPRVYDMICRADTLGVFQIESRAQMSMLPRLKPRRFYDLVIEVAIVRPGPIQGNMVHPYLKRREDQRRGLPITYPSEELKTALERTLGVPLFQEQAMQIAILAAGFQPAEADKLRRAMATFRRTGQVSSFKEKMVSGMVKRGYEREFAENCFSQIEGFGEYGFPESHAASFALLVYVSCWFKAFYPDVFLAAILNSQPMGFYPPAQLIRDAREHGVVVRPVDVNFSHWDSGLEGGELDRAAIRPNHRSMQGIMKTRHAVRLGFSLVKGVSLQEMDHLVAQRGKGYVSLRDLWLRTGLKRLTIEKLADADCFRSMGLSRRQALWEAKALDKESAVETLPLFSARAEEDDLVPEASLALPAMKPGEEVLQDYRSLAFSLKAHPLSFLRTDLAQQGVVASVALEALPSGRRVTVAGLVLVRQRPGSAKGVIFMTAEDETGVANIIVWPKVMERYRPVVMGARLVLVRGRLQKKDGVIHVVAEHLEDRTALLGLLKREARTFALNSRVDEVLKPVQDHRQKTARRRDLADLAAAMPKGRNFH